MSSFEFRHIRLSRMLAISWHCLFRLPGKGWGEWKAVTAVRLMPENQQNSSWKVMLRIFTIVCSGMYGQRNRPCFGDVPPSLPRMAIIWWITQRFQFAETLQWAHVQRTTNRLGLYVHTYVHCCLTCSFHVSAFTTDHEQCSAGRRKKMKLISRRYEALPDLSVQVFHPTWIR